MEWHVLVYNSAEEHLSSRDQLPEYFAECPASELATLVQSHLQPKPEGHALSVFSDIHLGTETAEWTSL